MHTEACENDKARADSLSFLVLSDLRLHVLHYITLISHPFEFWKSRWRSMMFNMMSNNEECIMKR